MKTLKSLLSSDFDINIEPVIPKFKNQDTAMAFAKYLGRINGLVTSYHIYTQSLQALEEMRGKLNDLQFPNPTCVRLADGLEGILKSHTPAQIKQKDYDFAIDELSSIRPAAAAAENIESMLIRIHAPKNVVMMPEHPDNDLWAIRIYQLKYISGTNWIDNNLDALKSGIEKIKNVDGVEYPPTRHSLLITIKR